MKRVVALAVGLLAFLLLVACHKDVVPSTSRSNPKISLSYSNLLDEQTQKEVAKSLETALSVEDSKRFLEQVSFYNHHIPTESLVQSGYGTSETLVPAYDIGAISDGWIKHFPVFPGYNCRLTTFQLLKSSLRMSPILPVDDSLLFIDKEALLDAPAIYQLQPEEQERFKTLFSAVATENTTDTRIHIEKVQDYWKQQGIQFTNPKVKMILVWFHDQLEQAATKLFIGHVGVLVPDQQQGYLFIEKISFEEPYQVLRFQEKQAVYDYLMAKYDTDTSGSTPPFVMENQEAWPAKL